MLVVVCGRDKCCLSVRFTCLLCVCTVLCPNCGESHRSYQKRPKRDSSVTSQKNTCDIMDNLNMERYNAEIEKRRTLPCCL
ncbi:hypothetical protein NP493_678g01046 [Ridgeia piscesae]|uniref:Uncharacterized protein n=1 Tax=Ridgeia piscesae TaxID=27915 RepID=A0AAD9KRH0_RIDPI|nr:hypothetical protein NP493_678g01046 [Ridgeia piscesae]